MDDAYPYRVKFRDIRVRPPNGRAAHAGASTRRCDHKGCDAPGDHPAPKRQSAGRHWFCQRHAAEYNRSWNFFDTMTEAEVAAFNEAERLGHKRTWRFGAGPFGGAKSARAHDPRAWRGREFFEEGEGSAGRARPASERTRLQTRALDELDLDHDAAPAEIRARYADYVRRFHPDSNGGDRSSEHKLARVIRAFKTLKAAGLTKDRANGR